MGELFSKGERSWIENNRKFLEGATPRDIKNLGNSPVTRIKLLLGLALINKWSLTLIGGDKQNGKWVFVMNVGGTPEGLISLPVFEDEGPVFSDNELKELVLFKLEKYLGSFLFPSDLIKTILENTEVIL
jgi:hypothetical protein